MKEEYLLEVKNISKRFTSKANGVQAVKDVSFSLKSGETLSIVGESGCGKTTTGKLILRLLEADSGEIWFKGQDIRRMSKRELKKIRPSMQIVFQDPYGSLNPRMNIKKILSEPVKVDKKLDRRGVQRECERLIRSVGLEAKDLEKYPHEFSGGQRQRIGIARAIATKPDLIVCDEPVSALDLIVQAQILELLKNLQDEYGYSYIFISHNLSVVRHVSDNIAIMNSGEIVEYGSRDKIFETPSQPYTKILLDSILEIKPNGILNYTEDDFEDEDSRQDLSRPKSFEKYCFGDR